MLSFLLYKCACVCVCLSLYKVRKCIFETEWVCGCSAGLLWACGWRGNALWNALRAACVLYVCVDSDSTESSSTWCYVAGQQKPSLIANCFTLAVLWSILESVFLITSLHSLLSEAESQSGVLCTLPCWTEASYYQRKHCSFCVTGRERGRRKQRHLFDVCQEKRNPCPTWLLTRFRFSWHAMMTRG